MKELRSTRPQSELVNERMDELEFAFYEAGPSRYGRLAKDYLLQCTELTPRFPPTVVNKESIKQACSQLEAAARHSPIEEASARMHAATKDGS
jgi:hypothetical protein